MAFTKNDILSTLILNNYKLLKVIDRFGIKLGFGNQSIHHICKKESLNADLLCLIMNIFCDQNFKIPKQYQYEYIPQLIKYLEESHNYFLGEEIPGIQSKIAVLVYNVEEPNASLIKNFFDNYITEVNDHMGHENKIVFSYILKLYNSYLYKDVFSTGINFSMAEYEKDHDDIEQVLLDLKNLLIKHLPQTETSDNRVDILVHLFELEHELHIHQRVEDELLIPLVKNLEKQITGVSKNVTNV